MGRRIRTALILLLLLPTAARAGRFALFTAPPGASAEEQRNVAAYARVLDSVALPFTQLPARSSEEDLGSFSALIVPAATARALNASGVERMVAAVRGGALLVTEEDTPLARALGLTFGPRKVRVQSVHDMLYPDVAIIWQKPAEAAGVIPRENMRVLAREKWSGAPLALVFPQGRGRVLYLAAELDPLHGEGYGRFPYLVQALVKECGVSLPFRSPRLSAFFDYGYRVSVDLEYFARRWRRSGVLALHVSAWQFYDRTSDDYLRRLIAACQRNGILVYAWFELPHVSDSFWEQHPEWREKTATLEDGRFFWRALINLFDPAAFRAVSEGMLRLLSDFDWDGVNIAELYFEPPSGPADKQHFTPMNDIVRAEFRSRMGWDPLELFDAGSSRHWQKDPASWKQFTEFRAELVKRLHEQVLGVTEKARRNKPYLDLVVTFVDNLYDPRMKEAIGCDVKLILPLARRFDFTLVLEDPFTLWALGPARYRLLGERYQALAQGARLGIDINIVERFQEVFPTRKQTGGEFLQLFHTAGEYFPTVLVYFEQSVYPQDMELVSHALVSGARLSEKARGRSVVESAQPVIFRPEGDGSGRIMVDGAEWPAREGNEVILPAGKRAIEVRAGTASTLRLHRLTGELLSAAYEGSQAFRFRYRSRPRAAALFSARPIRLLLDGAPYSAPVDESFGEFSVLLPPGEHEVRAQF